MSAKQNTAEINRKIYKNRYQNEFEAETEWLRRSAIERVNTIQHFIGKHSIAHDKILDLGCGTGAVYEELKKRGIGEDYVGIDYSEKAVEYFRSQHPELDIRVKDICSDTLSIDGKYDLVIMIHLLQHLENPGSCLESFLNRLDVSYMIIEVALEDFFLKRLLSLFRREKKDTASTMQSFSLKSVNNMLETNNIKIIDRKLRAPVYDLSTLQILRVRFGWSLLKYYEKIITSFLIPKLLGPIKKHTYYAYYSVLCEKGDRA